MTRTRFALLLPASLLAGACGLFSSGPRPPAPPSPQEQYAALPDTIVCVVDRSSARGLTELDAKKAADGTVVVLSRGRVRPFAQLYPANADGGYANDASWFTAGDSIALQASVYQKVGGERLIRLGELKQFSVYKDLPIFAAPNDAPPPRAVYLAVHPGCVFQAYVRSDLMG